MAFHRRLTNGRLILGVVPGNLERLIRGDTIEFEVEGLHVVIVGGRTPAIAAERMREVEMQRADEPATDRPDAAGGVVEF